MSSTACIANEKKHDIQGLELGMPRHDALEKLKSMNCVNNTGPDAMNPEFHMSYKCPNINFDIRFAERLAGSPLIQIDSQFEGILTLEEQKKSIEQQYDVVLSRDPGRSTFRGYLGQKRTIIFSLADMIDEQSVHDWQLDITDGKLDDDDNQAEQESTRQKFSTPHKF